VTAATTVKNMVEVPERFPRKVIKGGSHLCAPNYCLRYRPAVRDDRYLDLPHRLSLRRPVDAPDRTDPRREEQCLT
jgi:hypothetical protein